MMWEGLWILSSLESFKQMSHTGFGKLKHLADELGICFVLSWQDVVRISRTEIKDVLDKAQWSSLMV